MIKEKIKFKDKTNTSVFVEIELKNDSLSIMGQYGIGDIACYGQIQDHIQPVNKEQKRLVEIWNEYHLNDLTPGTPEQMRALKGKDLPYDEACEYLKEKGLYEVEYNGKLYKYGQAWLHTPLPKGFEKKLKELILKLNKNKNEK